MQQQGRAGRGSKQRVPTADDNLRVCTCTLWSGMRAGVAGSCLAQQLYEGSRLRRLPAPSDGFVMRSALSLSHHCWRRYLGRVHTLL